jgi:hypothetical protein
VKPETISFIKEIFFENVEYISDKHTKIDHSFKEYLEENLNNEFKKVMIEKIFNEKINLIHRTMNIINNNEYYNNVGVNIIDLISYHNKVHLNNDVNIQNKLDLANQVPPDNNLFNEMNQNLRTPGKVDEVTEFQNESQSTEKSNENVIEYTKFMNEEDEFEVLLNKSYHQDSDDDEKKNIKSNESKKRKFEDNEIYFEKKMKFE